MGNRKSVEYHFNRLTKGEKMDSVILKEIQDQNGLIDGLMALVAELEARLSAILSGSKTLQAGRVEAAAVPKVSPLAETIQAHNEKLRNLGNFINEIKESIDL